LAGIVDIFPSLKWLDISGCPSLLILPAHVESVLSARGGATNHEALPTRPFLPLKFFACQISVSTPEAAIRVLFPSLRRLALWSEIFARCDVEHYGYAFRGLDRVGW
jgi:hypothetical protein